MMREIQINYVLKIDEKDFQKAVKIAEENGFNYSDAGPVETLKRSLINEGVDNTFPEKDFGLKEYVTRLDTR